MKAVRIQARTTQAWPANEIGAFFQAVSGGDREENLLEKAVAFAAVRHSGTKRKGTKIPYIIHPMEVAAIAAAVTSDEAVIAAAVLHDVLEDTDTPPEELEALFGHRVASLAAEESENKREGWAPEATWRIRKQETIGHLKAAGHEARIIALGDKLANLRAIHRDYEAIGDALWERFNEKDKQSHAWYYAGVLSALEEDELLAGSPLLDEYACHWQAVFGDAVPPDRMGMPPELRCLYADETEEVREAVRGRGRICSLILDRTEDPDLRQIQTMAMIYDWFLRTDETGFSDTHLRIVNEPGSDDVGWMRTGDGYAIRLCAESGRNWCQAGYQLGYAMMRCLIDHLGGDQPAVRWAEELIAEAAALTLLKRLQEHWTETPFGQADPGYAAKIPEYLGAKLKERGTSALIGCRDRDELRRLNEANRFGDRINESHMLFGLMDAADPLKLASVRNFAADPLLLFTHSWRHFFGGSQAIEFLCRLQEQIPGCELPAGVTAEVDLTDSRPTAEQRRIYAAMIRRLQPLPGEYVIFSFLDSDAEDGEQTGLVFYQATRERDGRILAELRLDTRTCRTMYRLLCGDDRAAGVLEEILTKNEVPDLTGWEDMTEQIFGRRQKGD